MRALLVVAALTVLERLGEDQAIALPLAMAHLPVAGIDDATIRLEETGGEGFPPSGRERAPPLAPRARRYFGM